MDTHTHIHTYACVHAYLRIKTQLPTRTHTRTRTLTLMRSHTELAKQLGEQWRGLSQADKKYVRRRVWCLCVPIYLSVSLFCVCVCVYNCADLMGTHTHSQPLTRSLHHTHLLTRPRSLAHSTTHLLTPPYSLAYSTILTCSTTLVHLQEVRRLGGHGQAALHQREDSVSSVVTLCGADVHPANDYT